MKKQFALVNVTILACATLFGCSKPAPVHEMTPRDFLANAVQMKKMGRVGESRKMLFKCIAAGGNDSTTAEAKHFLITQLPRLPVTKEAEQRNAIGYNQLVKGDLVSARRTFETLIHDFPKFEWPYNNLALLNLQEKRLDDAARLLEQVTKLNPNYGNAWATLAQVREAQQDYAGEKQCQRQLARLQNRLYYTEAEIPLETPGQPKVGI